MENPDLDSGTSEKSKTIMISSESGKRREATVNKCLYAGRVEGHEATGAVLPSLHYQLFVKIFMG